MILPDFSLRGSMPSRIEMRTCCKCGMRRTSEGGVETSPGRFTCRECWRRKALAKPRRKR